MTIGKDDGDGAGDGNSAGDSDPQAVRGCLDGLVRARLTGPFSHDVPLVSLGFDSLAAIELWARLRADLGVDIPAGDLLELTPDGLAARVLAEGGSVTAAGPVTGGPAEADLDDASPEAAANLLAALDGLDDAGMARLMAELGPGAHTTPAD
ncbi:acyl carrier protein [Streptomyces sp. NBC_00083]|uniref:acyl carrier protein n=1 Tax=Streptomyces sp. NBC_00083 TaxID=2975647 RepID=UPI002253BD5F|nr:acyl carrier protein [Streptomyces sp. NBC_00083]MCX5386202.1 acyl carrier protein [Streptomyces sp. NBC_00083]